MSSITRITAKAVRQALIQEKGYSDAALPCENTIGNILNRLDYRLKRLQKITPRKKIPETDAIFANIAAVNQGLKDNPQQYRLIDDNYFGDLRKHSDRMKGLFIVVDT